MPHLIDTKNPKHLALQRRNFIGYIESCSFFYFYFGIRSTFISVQMEIKLRLFCPAMKEIK